MRSTDWPVYTPWGREHYRRGFEDGIAEGRAEAKAERRAKSVLLVLSARGFDVPDDAGARINSCTDLAQLETWLIRAATVQTMQELFD